MISHFLCQVYVEMLSAWRKGRGESSSKRTSNTIGQGRGPINYDDDDDNDDDDNDDDDDEKNTTSTNI